MIINNNISGIAITKPSYVPGTFRCEVSSTGDTPTRVISRQVLIPYLSNKSGGVSSYMIEGKFFSNETDIEEWCDELKQNCSQVYFNGISGEFSPDFGVYQCFTGDLDLNTAAEHTDYFVVKEETLQITGVSSSHITVNKTNDAKLECIVTGYPLKVLTWRKTGRDEPLNTTSTKLLWNSPTSITISNVVLEDAGFYQCETETGILSDKIKVEVLVQNKLVSMTSDKLEYVEGMEVVFSVLYEVNEHDTCTAEVYFQGARVEGDGVISERIKVLQIDNSSR